MWRAVLVALACASGCADRGVIVARQRPLSGAAGSAGLAETAASADAGGVAGAGGEGLRRPTFAPPSPIVELSDPVAKDQDPTVTADLTEIFFFSDRGGDEDLWTARRANATAPWGSPEPVPELNGPESEENPAVSRDGLRIWFYSRREPPGIWTSSREDRDAPWAEPLPVRFESESSGVIAPALDDTETRLALSMGAADSHDLYEATRASRDSDWGPLVRIEGINSDQADSTPFLVDRGEELLFSSGRSGAGDLFWAHRGTVDDPVDRVEALVELNEPDSFDTHPCLAVDRSVVFFGSDRSGGTDLYSAVARSP